MKNVIAFLLIFGIAGSSFHLDELAKLPVLVSHFKEHRKANNSTLLAFLYEHYVKSQQHPRNERDKRKNEQLPFKSLNSINHLATACPMIMQTLNPEIPEGKAEFSFYLLPYTGAQPFDIWQPPKLG